MTTWSELELQFRGLAEPLHDLELHWSEAGSCWRIEGVSDVHTFQRFEELATIAGVKILRTLPFGAPYYTELRYEEEPKLRWFRALSFFVTRIPYQYPELGREARAMVHDAAQSSALLCGIFLSMYGDPLKSRAGVTLPLAPGTQSKSASLKLFISYAREDYGSAKRMCNELIAAGFDVWIDRESLLPGQRWESTIKAAIYESECFIALLSSQAVNKRGYVQRELRYALDILDQMPESKIFLIPARLDECKPTHSALLQIQWVDLFPDWDEGVERIRRALVSRL